MRTSAAIAAGAASLVVVIAFAVPAASGSDRAYTVRCIDFSGSTVVAKAFDARLIEEAVGKAHAIELFKQRHPAGHCWVTRPHTNRGVSHVMPTGRSLHVATA
jgi:hypothetical protein